MLKTKGVLKEMESIEAILDVLNNSTGTESYHRFSAIPGYPVITDGVLMLAEANDCFWLLDVIAGHQSNRKLDKDFQVWKLIVDTENDSAVVQGYNDTTLVITQEIPYTDFPLEELKLYLMNGVILLPSEY